MVPGFLFSLVDAPLAQLKGKAANRNTSNLRRDRAIVEKAKNAAAAEAVKALDNGASTVQPELESGGSEGNDDSQSPVCTQKMTRGKRARE